MSSPPVKVDARAAAEARRQKILASRGNRLAKLTNTARGAEGGGVFDNDAPLAAFSSPGPESHLLGSEDPVQSPLIRAPTGPGRPTIVPAPPRGSSSIYPFDTSGMNAVYGPMAAPNRDSAMQEDPLMAMMQAMASGNAPSGVPSPPRLTLHHAPSRVSQWLPLVHALSIIFTLLYAATVLEPNAWRNLAGEWPSDSAFSVWQRWKPLVTGRATGMELQTVPVFYIFLGLELALHTLRLVSERNVPPPPGLVASILPYLPPRFQMYVTGGMKYFAIGQQFLDDLGLLIFVLGIMVWLANL
ncbi:hypothetical protein CALCODRAFT_494840 [Calocera cornea HHB12733]|uniref:GET complex, subunit GET2 n=1 Tax=Calocera cornea HHB12733 TaxID=1353952 RepID=A0A165GVT6_9BASI|nr:hypothetical protein CALCODRAFT_494835 [Calocera cornea HHB12733]KZT58550.1 hypothetical protein CALCODRAFT_494840 [Calocera cornea HHB12733]